MISRAPLLARVADYKNGVGTFTAQPKTEEELEAAAIELREPLNDLLRWWAQAGLGSHEAVDVVAKYHRVPKDRLRNVWLSFGLTGQGDHERRREFGRTLLSIAAGET